jgi:hypothetical protein
MPADRSPLVTFLVSDDLHVTQRDDTANRRVEKGGGRTSAGLKTDSEPIGNGLRTDWNRRVGPTSSVDVGSCLVSWWRVRTHCRRILRMPEPQPR